jgi:hypothetical protein
MTAPHVSRVRPDPLGVITPSSERAATVAIAADGV